MNTSEIHILCVLNFKENYYRNYKKITDSYHFSFFYKICRKRTLTKCYSYQIRKWVHNM